MQYSLTEFSLLFDRDVNNAMSRREIDAIFRLSDIISNAKQKITVYDCNLVTGDGIMDIVSWLSQSNPD